MVTPASGPRRAAPLGRAFPTERHARFLRPVTQPVAVARHEPDGRGHQSQGGMATDLLVAEPGQPPLHGVQPTARDEVRDMAPQQVARLGDIARVDRVLDRPVGIVVVLVPRARAAV